MSGNLEAVPDPPTPGEGLAVILGQLAEAIRMPRGGDRKVEAWEQLMNALPEMETAVEELQAALDGETPIEEIKEILPVILKMVAQLNDIAEHEPPSFEMTSTYFLRRLDARVERIEKKLDWHMEVAHGSDIADRWDLQS
jgi:hypothetical protein